jgi:hypothetical protein
MFVLDTQFFSKRVSYHSILNILIITFIWTLKSQFQDFENFLVTNIMNQIELQNLSNEINFCNRFELKKPGSQISQSHQQQYTHQTSKIVNLPTPHVPVVLMSTSLIGNDLDGEEIMNCGLLKTASTQHQENGLKHELNTSNDSNANLNSENSSENLVDESLSANKSTSSCNSASVKKQPPPLMKKPEKSEEIMRKLGRSPPTDLIISSQITCSSSTSSTSTVSSLSSTSNNSPVGSTNGASTKTSNLSMRLTNSKATDV